MPTNLQRTLDEGSPDANSMEELQEFLDCHVSGDWGDLDQADKDSNDQALKTGGRLFSVYNTAKDIRVWVITESDRSYTTALLPSDN